MLWWGGCCGAEPGWEMSREQCQALEALGGGNRVGRWLLCGSPRCQSSWGLAKPASLVPCMASTGSQALPGPRSVGK